MGRTSNLRAWSPARLGLFAALLAAVAGLALATAAQVGRGPTTRVINSAPTPPRSGADLLAFGSTTATGAVLFRVGDPVHVWMVDGGGQVRWQRDYRDGSALGCAPCPAAVVRRGDGSAGGVGPDGSPQPPPAALAGPLVAVPSPGRVVLGSADPTRPGRVRFFVPTSAGLRDAGAADGMRLGANAAVVPATDGSGVTVFQASADPLRQAEFEVVRVTPAGVVRSTEPLPAPGDRPEPCQTATSGVAAWMFAQDERDGAEARTQVVVERTGAAPMRTVLAGWYGDSAVGAQGAVADGVVSGADGDLARSRVDLAWISPGGAVERRARVEVAASEPSVALDPTTARAAVAGSARPGAWLDRSGDRALLPAAAVAFDDAGGLWSVDRDRHVRRVPQP